MTAEACNLRPPWALSIWADLRYVYCEVPAKEGPFLVLKFALTEGGLTKALTLLSKRHSEYATAPGYYEMPQVKLTTKTGLPAFTESQRANARVALRKAGIL